MADSKAGLAELKNGSQNFGQPLSRFMRIAMLAPVEEPVPPKKYGGTELVVYNLTQQLVRMGHEVTLFASGESKTAAKLIPTFPHAIRTLKRAGNYSVRNSLNLSGAARVADYLKRNSWRFDIAHNHIGWMFLPFIDFLSLPVVTTFHGYLRSQVESEIYRNYKDHDYVSISRNQGRSAKHKLHFVANVYNGIDVSKFRFQARAKDYLAFLARISPEKGPLQAIEIAKQAGKQLIIGGKVDPVDRAYFEQKIAPLIDGQQIKFIGELGHPQKEKLLRHAAALLAPIQWDEPFGLYLVEAMACGTPVIAFKRGSIPEIIVDGETGFVVRDVAEAVRRVGDISKIKRERCRRRVTEHFYQEKMAAEYLDVYAAVLKKRRQKVQK